MKVSVETTFACHAYLEKDLLLSLGDSIAEVKLYLDLQRYQVSAIMVIVAKRRLLDICIANHGDS